jgi:tRNA splicing endonuclease
MKTRATPYPLRASGCDDFLALLKSSERRLPLVLLAPYANGDDNLLDAAQLARSLAGVAVVVELLDRDLTWQFADEVSRPLSCFDGGARIYWPGFSLDDGPRAHRLFFGAWIEQVGSLRATRAIERAIFAVAAFRFVPDQRLSDAVREVEASERQKRVEAKQATSAVDWEQYAIELDGQLESAKEAINNLEKENANLKENQKVLLAADILDDEEGSPVEDTTTAISSMREAVEKARSTAANLSVLESAIASANESSFLRPEEAYDALVDLGEFVDAWRKQRKQRGSGGDIIQYLREKGWGKRCTSRISDTTRSKYGSHYEFEFQGTRKMFEAHVTLGSGDANSCASIHFSFEPSIEKVVIAHVGKHLPNTKT